MRLLAFIVLLIPAVAAAATLRNVTVDRVDGVYVLRSEVWFDVSIEKIYGVFLDWDQSTKFSSVVVESRNVDPDEFGRAGYYSRNRVCLWFYCRSFERYGYVSFESPRFIEATADPERSDFHVSDERWEFREEDNGTVVVYDLVMKPKFFIPPVIGPAIMKRKLKNGGTAAIDRIEAVAKDWVPDGE
ncbi:MAG: hypothetical protein KAJ57_08010 [Woeseiaceae bacterium]|nr:hypothetical protein [Woeseiaceae bacterium]